MPMPPLLHFCLYGIFGWCAEIVWTAVCDVADAVKRGQRIDARLTGHTYLWMFPIYGAGGLAFEMTHAAVHGWAWLARGLVYMLGCFGVEYLSGWAIERAAGMIPWDYSHSRWHVHGLIRLDYAPVWLVFGFLLEWVEHLVHAVAPVLRLTL